jgi:AmmeMemoRadiSam system protein B/AmmeMemoRadiSam system protein A
VNTVEKESRACGANRVRDAGTEAARSAAWFVALAVMFAGAACAGGDSGGRENAGRAAGSGGGSGAGGGGGSKAPARPAAVAGQFYPAEREKLARAIDQFMAGAAKASGGRPVVIIAPHASYVYCGQIIADAFAQAAPYQYDVIVMLGTNHTTGGFHRVSVYASGGFETPLGVASIDEELAARLIGMDEDFVFEPSVHKDEHSIEVHVPFVQKLFPGVKIVPAVIGAPDPGLCERFGEALAVALEGRKALITVSSDLSHYPAYDDAERIDRKTLDAIATLDADKVQKAMQAAVEEDVPNLATCGCGEGPILAAIAAARKLGAKGARVVSYANSGDAAVGSRDRVVGYGAVVITAGAPEEEPSSGLGGLGDASRAQNEGVRAGGAPVPSSKATGEDALSDTDKRALLALARNSIQQYFDSETIPLARGFGAAAEAHRGAFVTLTRGGQLRGCIGHMDDDLPLCQVVGKCALQSAFADRRFPPLAPEELPQCEIEISVLTPMRPIGGYNDILVGRDGVLIEKDGRSAVFLPQVAVEQGWERDEMLAHLCAKAGLPTDAWKARDMKFYAFQAEVFGDKDLP